MLKHAVKVEGDLTDLVATPDALRALAQANVSPEQLLTSRHWENLDALAGAMLLSAYNLPTGRKVWLLTEWEPLQTTILLPEEFHLKGNDSAGRRHEAGRH